LSPLVPLKFGVSFLKVLLLPPSALKFEVVSKIVAKESNQEKISKELKKPLQQQFSMFWKMLFHESMD